MSTSKLPDKSTIKWLGFEGESPKEVAKWVNEEIGGKYEWYQDPIFSEDLCSCIVKVWDDNG